MAINDHFGSAIWCFAIHNFTSYLKMGKVQLNIKWELALGSHCRKRTQGFQLKCGYLKLLPCLKQIT